MKAIRKSYDINNLLSPGEVAEILGTTVGTLQIWRVTQRYPLPFVKIGRLVRYRLEDVQAFIALRTVTACTGRSSK